MFKDLLEQFMNDDNLIEGKEPVHDKDSEETQIKKLEEEKDEEKEDDEEPAGPEDSDFDSIPDEDDTESDIVDEPTPESDTSPLDGPDLPSGVTDTFADSLPSSEEYPTIEKEYLGQKDDDHFYMTAIATEDDSTEGFQLLDQEDNVVLTSNDLELEDVKDPIEFILKSIPEADIQFLTRDVFDKFILPEIVKAEEEEMEEDLENDVDIDADMTDGEVEEDRDEELPESKKKIQEVKTTTTINYNKRKLNVVLEEDHSTSDSIISVNGRSLPAFSSEFTKVYRDNHGQLSEKSIQELAKDSLMDMEEDELDPYLEGSDVIEKKNKGMKECIAEHRRERRLIERTDRNRRMKKKVNK